MLIEINRKDKEKSEYECDRCKKRYYSKWIKTIYVAEWKKRVPFKKWDMCLKCYRNLERGMEKYNG